MKKSRAVWLAAAAAGAVLTGKAMGSVARRSDKRLAGRIVLLTGGSRGLGLQLARELAQEGCKLILVARSLEELSAAAGELQNKGAEIRIIVCDLTSPPQLREMLLKAEAAYGHIDMVVNNAGRIDVGPVDSISEDDFQAAMDLMFWAPVRITLGLLPALLRSGDADVVNVCSIGGKVAVPHLLPYSSAKFALCGFSEGLDAEVRRRGVRVLTVIPGLLRTGSHKQAHFSGKQSEEYRWFALGATIPGVSMEVTRAARQIVSAIKAKRRSLTLAWSAQFAMRFHGAFPESTMMLMNYVNEFLPGPSRRTNKLAGSELHDNTSAAFHALTVLGEVAAKTQHEDIQPAEDRKIPRSDF